MDGKGLDEQVPSGGNREVKVILKEVVAHGLGGEWRGPK